MVVSRHPDFLALSNSVSDPQPSGGRVAGAPRNPKKPVFDFRAHFCHPAPMETHASGFTLRANATESQNRFPISNAHCDARNQR